MTLIALPPPEVYVTRLLADGTWAVIDRDNFENPVAVGLTTPVDARVRAEALNWIKAYQEASPEFPGAFSPSDVDEATLAAYEQIIRDGDLHAEWRKPTMTLDLGPFPREGRDELARERGNEITDDEEEEE